MVAFEGTQKTVRQIIIIIHRNNVFVCLLLLIVNILSAFFCLAHKPKFFEVTWAILDYSILINKESANEKSDVFA